ncbi:histone-lysine N-methyltransferase EHMT2-like isoform X1 [Artemia franciscana]|uniref:Uncharacterized protein n=1 Tax=Artemia franciscana TaxID=6661 RepID=A0AA88H6X7_ARTSF|nr:hypothetical protein QYM36_016901 [Artemia franciscana]KAK2704674.1 hypothetical protein QYM36_016901 [Artemia franciscana]
MQIDLSQDSSNVSSRDISNGLEVNPIICFAQSGDAPQDFIYVVQNHISSLDVKVDTDAQLNCDCSYGCSSTKQCRCARFSGINWYNKDKLDRYSDLQGEFEGVMLFECNDKCNCRLRGCDNRLVQKGLQYPLAVFQTGKKGWGLKTLRPIQAGTFVCEYLGEILLEDEADLRNDDSFMFSLGAIPGKPEYCIDSKKYGNVARFINHSCQPNLFALRVFIDQRDLSFPKVAFFASKDIQAGEELSMDYGDKFWEVKIKDFECCCDSSDCRYRTASNTHSVNEKDIIILN